jgi:hypothetical protein
VEADKWKDSKTNLSQMKNRVKIPKKRLAATTIFFTQDVFMIAWSKQGHERNWTQI